MLSAFSGLVVVWLHSMPMRPCLDVTNWMHCHDFGCFVRNFPFSLPCDDMLSMLVCATYWLYMHFYTLAYMSMHESCLLVCQLCFNIMKLWTFDLHLSPVDPTFCLPFLRVCLLSCLPSSFLIFLFILWLIMSLAICYVCHAYHAYLLYASFICSLHLFLQFLVCWFLVFAFACTHME